MSWIAVVMALQVAAGVLLLLGAVLTLAGGVSQHSPLGHLLLFVALAAAAAWYAAEPLILGGPTSTKPGLVFALVIAWALLRHGRHVRQVLILRAKWLGRRS